MAVEVVDRLRRFGYDLGQCGVWRIGDRGFALRGFGGSARGVAGSLRAWGS